MSEPDVVAELAWWMRLMAEDPEDRASPITAHDMLKRAHDEIVALRAKCIELSADRTRQLVADRKAKVLEEAARIAEHGGGPVGASIATAIRALKGQAR